MVKDLTFKRSTGNLGRAQQIWIDKQLPNCPFCHKPGPLWETAMEKRIDLNRYHFQCPGCGGIASVTASTISGPSIASASTMTHAAAKNAFRIECSGGSRSMIEVGRYYLPEELRKLAEVSFP